MNILVIEKEEEMTFLPIVSVLFILQSLYGSK
jgi:hypothetical protein